MRLGPFGATELIIILVIVLIIFGAGRLPQVLGSLGKGIREFRKGQRGEEEEPKPKVEERPPAPRDGAKS